MDEKAKWWDHWKYWVFFSVLAALVGFSCVAWPSLVAKLATNSIGIFGDQFGGLNTFFSALAFAALIVALIMQRDELRLQREELQLQRKDLKDTQALIESQAESMKQQVEIAKHQVELEEWRSNPELGVSALVEAVGTMTGSELGNAAIWPARGLPIDADAVSLKFGVKNRRPVTVYLKNSVVIGASEIEARTGINRPSFRGKLAEPSIPFGDARSFTKVVRLSEFPLCQLGVEARDERMWFVDEAALKEINNEVYKVKQILHDQH